MFLLLTLLFREDLITPKIEKEEVFTLFMSHKLRFNVTNCVMC